jgi:hypothetical protein
MEFQVAFGHRRRTSMVVFTFGIDRLVNCVRKSCNWGIILLIEAVPMRVEALVQKPLEEARN